MPPNSTISDKPVCVSDSFHFSSFYWRESSASLAGMDQSGSSRPADDDDSIAGAGYNNNNGGQRSRSGTIGSESDSLQATEQPVLKVSCSFHYRILLLFLSNSHGLFHIYSHSP